MEGRPNPPTHTHTHVGKTLLRVFSCNPIDRGWLACMLLVEPPAVGPGDMIEYIKLPIIYILVKYCVVSPVIEIESAGILMS